MAGLPAPDPAATCLVTGASSGIGEALARGLATRGYGVTLVARREERLRTLADELTATHGVRAEVLACDLAEDGARDALPAHVQKLGLRVDVLVNNAGFGRYGDFAELDPAREVEQVRVMCEAVVALCGAFVPGMAGRRSGAVLILSSTTGFQPTARYATYAAAKAFSLSFGQSLHAELRRSGVAVTTVCPGPVETDFFSENEVEPVRLPKAMWVTPDQVARAALDGLARNKRVVIPNAAVRALMASSRMSPAGLQLRVMDFLVPRR
jgi:short-subunit dehydrogenase